MSVFLASTSRENKIGASTNGASTSGAGTSGHYNGHNGQKYVDVPPGSYVTVHMRGEVQVLNGHLRDAPVGNIAHNRLYLRFPNGTNLITDLHPLYSSSNFINLPDYHCFIQIGDDSFLAAYLEPACDVRKHQIPQKTSVLITRRHSESELSVFLGVVFHYKGQPPTWAKYRKPYTKKNADLKISFKPLKFKSEPQKLRIVFRNSEQRTAH